MWRRPLGDLGVAASGRRCSWVEPFWLGPPPRVGSPPAPEGRSIPPLWIPRRPSSLERCRSSRTRSRSTATAWSSTKVRRESGWTPERPRCWRRLSLSAGPASTPSWMMRGARRRDPLPPPTSKFTSTPRSRARPWPPGRCRWRTWIIPNAGSTSPCRRVWRGAEPPSSPWCWPGTNCSELATGHREGGTVRRPRPGPWRWGWPFISPTGGWEPSPRSGWVACAGAGSCLRWPGSWTTGASRPGPCSRSPPWRLCWWTG